MGITLRSKHHEVSMGYGSFNFMRRKIADMLPDDWRMHHNLAWESEVTDWEAYDERTEDLFYESDKQTKRVINFLYAPDTEGHIMRKECKHIAKFMDEHRDMWESDTRTFAYLTHPSFTLSDFYEMLLDGAEKGGIRWI